MKLCVFPNTLLFHWFSDNSFHLFTPYGDVKKDVKKKKNQKKKKNPLQCCRKSLAPKVPDLKADDLKVKAQDCMEQEVGAGVFALTLPCWVILGMSFYFSGFAQQFFFTKPVNSIGPSQDGDVKEKKWKLGCLHSSLWVHPDGQCSRRKLHRKPGGQTPATLNSRNSPGIVEKRPEGKGAWINPSLIPQKPLPCRTRSESYTVPCHTKLLPRCLQRLQGVNRVIKRVAIRVAHPSNLKFPV